MNERLGHTYRDQITGFEGVAVGHCEYLTGCNQTLLAPQRVEAGKPAESQWFDDQRLTQHPTTPRFLLDNGTTPGCDKPAPKR